jgi:lipopolysaccharide biosynthesis regulator YciM
LTEAQKWLEKAIQIDSEDASSKLVLAEIFYRQDKFEQAAPLLRDAGQDARARTLDSFKGLTGCRKSENAILLLLALLTTCGRRMAPKASSHEILSVEISRWRRRGSTTPA